MKTVTIGAEMARALGLNLKRVGDTCELEITAQNRDGSVAVQPYSDDDGEPTREPYEPLDDVVNPVAEAIRSNKRPI